jgi:hypothetical protein
MESLWIVGTIKSATGCDVACHIDLSTCTCVMRCEREVGRQYAGCR